MSSMVHDITIKVVLNGWIVTVGCQEVVFITRAALLGALNNYLDDPHRVEKRFQEESVNSEQCKAPGVFDFSWDQDRPNPHFGVTVGTWATLDTETKEKSS